MRTATAAKDRRRLKVHLRSFNLLRDYFNSLNLSNLDELSTWSSIPKEHIRVQKKLNISSSLPSPSSDVKIPLLKLTNNSRNKRKMPIWKRSGYRILDAIIFLLVSLFDLLNQSRDRVFYQISKHFGESVQNAPLLAAHFFCGVLNICLKNGKKISA